MRSTSASNPSVIACRMLPWNRTLVPIRMKYTGTPASEQTKRFASSAALALFSMRRSVFFATGLVSRPSASPSATLVSSGIFFSDHS